MPCRVIINKEHLQCIAPCLWEAIPPEMPCGPQEGLPILRDHTNLGTALCGLPLNARIQPCETEPITFLQFGFMVQQDPEEPGKRTDPVVRGKQDATHCMTVAILQAPLHAKGSEKSCR